MFFLKQVKNFRGNDIPMMLEVLTITVGVASTAIQSGFKPRFEKYFKKFELKPQQVRAHTERLYREVYKPLSQVFVAENRRASFIRN